MKKIALSLLSLLMILCLFACGGKSDDPWKDAIHKEDVTLGDGATTVIGKVVAGEKIVTVTLKTDEKTLGEALFAEGLITGEAGPYGLYVKTVNGIFADYDTDGTYWALYINDEYAVTGVDTTPIEQGAVYKLAKEKG